MGAPFTLGIGARPLIARLRQHVVPPQPPNYSQLWFKVHPPNPPQGGFSCSLLPFAVRHINNLSALGLAFDRLGLSLLLFFTVPFACFGSITLACRSEVSSCSPPTSPNSLESVHEMWILPLSDPAATSSVLSTHH